MKKAMIFVGVVAAVVVMFFSLLVSTNNRAISLEEQITSADSDIKIQEKRRTDLIYNLADCVKDYDRHESNTLMEIVEARQKDGNMEVGDITTQLSVVAEAYPELKANVVYQDLMNELSITENLIAEHRKAYNDQVRTYNKFTKKFPNNLILNSMGHAIKNYNYLDYAEEERKSVNNLFGDKDE